MRKIKSTYFKRCKKCERINECFMKTEEQAKMASRLIYKCPCGNEYEEYQFYRDQYGNRAKRYECARVELLDREKPIRAVTDNLGTVFYYDCKKGELKYLNNKRIKRIIKITVDN